MLFAAISDGLEKRVQLPAIEDGNHHSVQTGEIITCGFRQISPRAISCLKSNTCFCIAEARLFMRAVGSERAIVGLPGNNLPSGVLHIMLLDEELNPLSERLVFNINGLM